MNETLRGQLLVAAPSEPELRAKWRGPYLDGDLPKDAWGHPYTYTYSGAGHPPFAFLRNYLLRGGIRDGVPGLIISTLNAYYVFLKFSKLWHLRHPAGAAQHSAGAAQHSAGATEHPHNRR